MIPSETVNGATWADGTHSDDALRSYVEGRRWLGFRPLVVYTWDRPSWMGAPPKLWGLTIRAKLQDGREVSMRFDPHRDMQGERVVVVETDRPTVAVKPIVSYTSEQREHPDWKRNP
jgi:hypothetical protein